MENLTGLEREVQALYDRLLRPLAARYAFELPKRSGDAPGLPTVLLLGNHSSGKSSFINFLLGHPLQATGLAPVDDGFTIIAYSETEDHYDGQTVVSHPQMPYRSLARFGPGFLSHLRMKTRPYHLLHNLVLIDSPGMIDAADADSGRGYDFPAVVRHFAENADLIVFFFDPDKPGTTGETMSIFTQSLSGLEHKLLIVMNKVDQFATIRDFARAYGALCWNLSKVIRTKDLPYIYNTYIPGLAAQPRPGEAVFPLEDFDVSRKEVIAEIEHAPARRADNLVSDLYENARMLIVHVRVCGAFAWGVCKARLVWWGSTVAAAVGTALLVWLLWGTSGGALWWIAALGVLLTLGCGWGGALFFRRRVRMLQDTLDAIFEALYAREMALGDRADLHALWAKVKERVVRAIASIGPERMPLLLWTRRALGRLERATEGEILTLRRRIETPEERQHRIAQAKAQEQPVV